MTEAEQGKRQSRQLRYYYRNREAECAKTAEWRKANPEKVREQKRRYYAKHRERICAERNAWYAANPGAVAQWAAKSDPGTIEKARAKSREWKAANPDKVREQHRKWMQSPQGKISNRIRSRMREGLRLGQQTSKTLAALGYTLVELRTHLERQFLPGMGWHNMGDWHIDHIVPLSSFDVAGPDDPELRRAWALTNLRPLWAKDNLAKSDKRLTLI